MTISPASPNKKNYLVINNKLTKAGWDFMKLSNYKNKYSN